MVVDNGAGDSGGVQSKYTEMREMLIDVEMTANYRLNYLLQQLRLVGVSSLSLVVCCWHKMAQYDQLLASSCRPSVRLCVRLSVCNAVHCGSQGLVYRAKNCTTVFLAGKFLFVSSDAIIEFLRHRQPRPHWFVACYIQLLTEIIRELWSVTLEFFVWVHSWTLSGRIGLHRSADCRPKLVTETDLIVCLYNWLSQQQLGFLYKINCGFFSWFGFLALSQTATSNGMMERYNIWCQGVLIAGERINWWRDVNDSLVWSLEISATETNCQAVWSSCCYGNQTSWQCHGNEHRANWSLLLFSDLLHQLSDVVYWAEDSDSRYTSANCSNF